MFDLYDIYDFVADKFDKAIYGKKAAAKKSSLLYDKEDRKYCSHERYGRGPSKLNHRTKKRGYSKYQLQLV